MKNVIASIQKCPRCEGTGIVDWKEMKDARVYNLKSKCPDCNGTGRIVKRFHHLRKIVLHRREE
jgi:uncharacterized phage protein